MQARTSAVRTLLETRLSHEGERGAALITMASDMVARALRGDIHPQPHVLRSDLQKAIVAATGCEVKKVFMDEPGRQFTRKRYSVNYSDSLATRIRERHWTRIRCGLAFAYGDKHWEKAKDRVWDALLADARPYGLTAWTNPDDAPRNTPGENLLTTLFYFVTFALTNSGEALEQMSNLVRLLPYAVPIGEWREQSGHWLFVIHPVL